MLTLIVTLTSLTCFAGGMNDDPALLYANLHRFEVQENNKEVLEAELWYGRDMAKWAIEIEAERHSNEVESFSSSLSHRKPISAFWDLELGLRHDQEPGVPSTRARIALVGIAPYFIETKMALHLGSNQTHLEIELEHELPITANWILESGLEIDVFRKDDNKRHEKSGLSELEASLLLKYERHKNLHPYFGIEHKRQKSDKDELETAFVLGLSYWF